jgi:hypothetical protein
MVVVSVARPRPAMAHDGRPSKRRRASGPTLTRGVRFARGQRTPPSSAEPGAAGNPRVRHVRPRGIPPGGPTSQAERPMQSHRRRHCMAFPAGRCGPPAPDSTCQRASSRHIRRHWWVVPVLRYDVVKWASRVVAGPATVTTDPGGALAGPPLLRPFTAVSRRRAGRVAPTEDWPPPPAHAV